MPNREVQSELGFVKVECNGSIDYWCIDATGHYADDCMLGRGYAKSLVERMRRTRSPTMLGHIVSAITTKGQYGAVEIGFFQQISEHLLA